MSDVAHLRKDEILDRLAARMNVAQFVAFAPSERGPVQTYSRILGEPPNVRFATLEDTIARLYRGSPERKLNIRSYTPSEPRSREFRVGIGSVDAVVESVNTFVSDGLHIIVNESVDLYDGGVSGVAQGGIAEFSPHDTPRCVERAGVVSLPLSWFVRMVETVYEFRPDLEVGHRGRLEFSVHPRPRGWRQTKLICWEMEDGVERTSIDPLIRWPNRFSQVVGDKAYGLLMAWLAGFSVPLTTVFNRQISQRFSFGIDTGTRDVWVRTCPHIPHPGEFATQHGWVDPYQLLDREDPHPRKMVDPFVQEGYTGYVLPSAIVQMGVNPAYSGSAITDAAGKLVVEGVKGKGDDFMLGRRLADPLPTPVTEALRTTWVELARVFGSTRFEWVHDGKQIWIVQLHTGATAGTGATIVPGEAEHWVVIDANVSLQTLNARIVRLRRSEGLLVRGNIGLTSHKADAIRRAGHPARLADQMTDGE
jgi:hypothetical protein